MLTGEMARLRIEDRIREAEVERLARSARSGRPVRATGFVRRLAAAMALAVLRPIKP